MSETSREGLHMALAQAYTRCEDETVARHLRAALYFTEQLPPTPLVECPICGRLGLPERIRNHECSP